MLTKKSPAKINWFLKIFGSRKDGFHEIGSLIQKITLYDTLIFTPSDDVQVITDASIQPEENIIRRAAMLLKSRYNVEKGVTVELQKNIPMGAGLGGGSSNAASTLRGLNELWALGLTEEELFSAAEHLGSDVPFFLGGPLSYASGRGEKLIPRRAQRPLHLLLVKPAFDVATSWAYRTYTLLTKKDNKLDNIEFFIRNIEQADPDGLPAEITNDLERVTITKFPVIAGIKQGLRGQGAKFSLMSGSGSTVFGVFDSQKKAEEASHHFGRHWTAAVETITEEA